MAEATFTPGSQRDRERKLDAAASPLDVHTDTNFRETLRLVGRAISYIRYFWVRFTAKFLLMWLSLLSPLILPWPLKIVIDNVVLGTPTDPEAFPVYFAPFVRFLDGMGPVEMMLWIVSLGAVLVIAFGAFGTATDFTEAQLEEGHDTATQTENEANAAYSKFAGIAGFVEFRLQLRLSQALNHLLRSQLFERIQALPMRVLNDQRIGDSLYRVLYDTPALTNVFYQIIMSPVLAIITAFVILLVMSFNYGDAPEVVYIALFILPMQSLAIIPFPRLMRRKSQASRAAGAVTTGNVEEGMSNVLAVQSLGGNRQERGRFDRHSNESFKRFRGQVLVGIMVRASMGVARGLLGLVAFYLISARVIEGVLTPGDYGVLIYYYAWFSGALTAIPYVWIRIQHNIPGVRRVFFLMDLPGEAYTTGRQIERIRDGFEMRGVGLEYPDGRRALSGIDLNAKVGDIIALVGPTGAGKTTLAHLLPAFHAPTEGTLSIDGVDVSRIAVASLRRHVAYVFQETQLFSDSIFDNIRYAKHDATLAEVERVARIAGAHDFIAGLPNGYDTQLGTVTSKLSVGQKQRIAIARGLLQDASILILDEPTSALDPETEAYLVDALEEAAKDKLVVVIAHRLSTVARAHKVVFLEGGKIVEQGPPEDLLGNPDGRYRAFVQLQSA
ncbi:MAG: ABC transporter ATP-binding protein [Gammaproteobacteria bacterium]|nr:ABC transporter ATP-binding protein [Gammaproteobacteria bacterium]MYK46143.1 ABC transporter ATP-binding protein [Gammaproteobacteria bacterium]